jgi:hypothetical protein
MNGKLIALFLLILPLALLAQKSKVKEGSTPESQVYLVEGDSLTKIQYLIKNEDNRIRVVVSGGIEQVKHIVVVTSKNAVVITNPTVKNEFIVRPSTDVPCEIIVDVKTFETYYHVKFIEVAGGKKMKQIVKKYPPRTYMVGYEKFKVK